VQLRSEGQLVFPGNEEKYLHGGLSEVPMCLNKLGAPSVYLQILPFVDVGGQDGQSVLCTIL
jgi:hypothetical protein